jgi:DNA invertase Pin-like site-specific DNA recombinase
MTKNAQHGGAEPMRALIYARYSSALQSGASIEDQVRICRERADREGWPVAGVFEDAEVSGRVRERPGLNAMLAAVREGDVVLTESIDRLSRAGGDMWELFDRIAFAGARIVSLAEGDVAELHVGFKGTMSALFRKDLADKTRRGQVGRVLAGRCPGGRVYGYRRVARFDEHGEPIRGLREIDPDQAAIVVRIYEEFVDGRSPREIAKRLNAEGVPSPAGGRWSASSINGDRVRKNGVLQNELYRGVLIFMRQKRTYEPASRLKRLKSRPEAEWTVERRPELRIVPEALWEAVSARRARFDGTRAEQQRRPKRLLSGLVKCGCCGSNYIVIGKEQWGCGGRRQRGDCANGRTIMTGQLERRVIAGLQRSLLDPDVVRAAVVEHHKAAKERADELAREARGAERRRDKAKRDVDRLVRAVADGGSEFAAIRDALERARSELETAEAAIAAAKASTVIALHPGVADDYRRNVANLCELLGSAADEDRARQVKQRIRALIDRVIVTPAEGRGTELRLEGRLTAILNLAGGPPASSSTYDNDGDPNGSLSLAHVLRRGRC